MDNEKNVPLDIGGVVDDARLKHILNGLRERTLPKPEWTHAAHLVAGSKLAAEFGLAGAEAQMPGIIRAYNEATGVPNTDDEGYHQTLTIFYLRKVDQFLSEITDGALAQRVTALLSSPYAARSFPLEYYTRELLFSVNARRNWVEPDIKPI